MALTTAGRNAILASGAPGITHIGAYEDLGTTETSGGSYARQAITFAAAAGGIRDNNAQLSVPIAAGKTIVVASAHDALSAGNLLGLIQIGSTLRGAANALASTDLITSYAHGLTTDDRIFVAAVGGDTLPTGLATTTLYFVLASGLTTDAFKISTTSGGAAVDITANGEFAWFKTVPNTFASAGNLVFATGALDLDATFV
jgi:hypothetical protein